MGIDMEAIIIVFIVIGLPVIATAFLIGLKIMRGGSSSQGRKAMEEETRIIQEIYRGLNRMEERVEALETIIISRERKERD
jgi:phage shock protein B